MVPANGDLVEGHDHADLPGLLSGESYAPRRGLSWFDAAQQSYRNMATLAAS